jgi:excisionase family DNA binding protein
MTNQTRTPVTGANVNPGPKLHRIVVSVKEACAIGSWSRGTLYKKLASGDLEAVKDGDRTKVTIASIEAHLASLPRFNAEAA